MKGRQFEIMIFSLNSAKQRVAVFTSDVWPYNLTDSLYRELIETTCMNFIHILRIQQRIQHKTRLIQNFNDTLD